MLQTKDGQRPSSRVLHGIVIGSMVILAVAASALRVPAHSEEQAQEGIRIATRTGADRAQAQPAAKVAAGVPAVRRSSFDLSYLPAAKQGMLGIRPNIIFARPDMQTVTAIIDAAIKRKLSEFGVDEDVEFSIADLEQALGPISVEVKDPDGEPGQRGRIMMTLSAVRSEKPLPLKEVLEATAPGTTVTGSESGSVLETPVPAFPRIGPMRRFAMPDDRTVLPGMGVDALENLKQRPVAEQIAAKPWFGLWQQVEQHMFAMLLNNSAVDWNLPLENTEYPQVTTLITHSKYLALAYDWQGDELNVLLIVDCQDAEATDSIVASLNGLAKQLIREAEKPVADKPTEADFAAAAYVRVLRAFETAKADVDGARVTLRASAKVETSAVVAYAAMYANELTRSAQPVSRGVTD